ncbi:MAG: DCC1-like thiol-disulfide oxidoreductase family protein, partial [Alphaproteobacteria bacterium]|nr:DCC1-like thiol-disulfide oxidoreductase family protein [Alphaproteobacteria bacterium]
KYQQRKHEGYSPQIEWIDVHADTDAVTEIGTDLEFVRERLHMVDESGKIQVGSEAFLALWKRTPGQKRLAWFCGLPIIRTFFRWSYNGFATVLYRWNRRNGRW